MSYNSTIASGVADQQTGSARVNRVSSIFRGSVALRRKKMHFISCFTARRAFSLLGAVVATSLTASLASANSGALLPLDQYQAGTEQVQNTIVTNGSFESVTGNQPNGWTLPAGQSFKVGTPTGANTSNAVNGNFAAQGPLQSAVQRNGYNQTVTLQPNTDYVLSAYLWNFSDQTNGNFDLALVELKGSTNGTKNVALAPSDTFYSNPPINGARGVFAYQSFNSAQLSGTVNLQVAFEYDSGFPFPHGPDVLGQIDNVAITPAGQFAPPVAVPEPASLSLLLGTGAVLGMRRRKA